MKKVINGMVYNTDTATLLADDWNGVGSNDFYYCLEELYVTKKGNYFLFASGGALSKYSKCVGRNQVGIKTIIELTEQEAYEWLEKNNEHEVIEEHFPNYIEEA